MSSAHMTASMSPSHTQHTVSSTMQSRSVRLLATALTLAHLFGETLVADATLTFTFRCKADLPPVVEPFYFGFISAGSKASGVVDEWSPWRSFVAQDLGDSRVSEEIAPGVFKLRLYVSNVNPTYATPVHMQIIKQNGANVTLHSELISGTFGLFVTCADVVSCGAFAPVYVHGCARRPTRPSLRPRRALISLLPASVHFIPGILRTLSTKNFAILIACQRRLLRR